MTFAPPPRYTVPPFAGPSTRVAQHLQTLGMLWLVYSALRALGALLALLFVDGFFGHHWHSNWEFGWSPFGSMWHAVFWPFALSLFAANLALTLLPTYALLTRQPWGRILTIVCSVLCLFHPPLGTALGIYTLWVLAPAASGVEYAMIAKATPHI
jgi:hypothetical protein